MNTARFRNFVCSSCSAGLAAWIGKAARTKKLTRLKITVPIFGLNLHIPISRGFNSGQSCSMFFVAAGFLPTRVGAEPALVACSMLCLCYLASMHLFRFRYSFSALLLLVLVASSAFAKEQKFVKPGPVQLTSEGNKWAEKTLKKLSLEEKVGQMIQVRAFADFLNVDSDE